MRCDKCIYSNYDNNCKLSRCEYRDDYKEERKQHKCYRCTWSKWTGIKYVCSLPRCMPDLGNFKKVIKSETKKKNS